MLEKACTFCVKQIGRLSQVANQKVRTYCRVARKAYLNFTKTKRKTSKQIRRMHQSLLQYLQRNIKQLKTLTESAKTLGHTIVNDITETFATVQKIYDQPKEMNEENYWK